VHPLYDKAHKLSREVIGAAIEGHRHKGPGLIESIYERCLLRELELRSIPATTQKLIRVEYKGLLFDEPLRFDILRGRLFAGRAKSGRDFASLQQSAALQLDEVAGYSDRVADQFSRVGSQRRHSRMILPGANRTEEDESSEILL
jgi:GxxExxY protein